MPDYQDAFLHLKENARGMRARPNRFDDMTYLSTVVALFAMIELSGCFPSEEQLGPIHFEEVNRWREEMEEQCR